MRRLRAFALAGCVLSVAGCVSGGTGQSGLQRQAGSVCSTAAATAPRAVDVGTSMVAAPGSPFGVAASRDGRWVFVATDRALVAYAVDRGVLRRTGQVPVPGSPAGVAVTGDGRWVIIADSNRSSPRSGGNLAIVDTRAALAHQPALRGYAPVGRFPRDIAVLPGPDAVVVTNYDSQQVEMVDLANLH